MAIKLLSSDITPKANAALLTVTEEKRIVEMALLGPEPRAQQKKGTGEIPQNQTTLKID